MKLLFRVAGWKRNTLISLKAATIHPDMKFAAQIDKMSFL